MKNNIIILFIIISFACLMSISNVYADNNIGNTSNSLNDAIYNSNGTINLYEDLIINSSDYTQFRLINQ